MSLSPPEISGSDLKSEHFQEKIVAGCRPVVIRQLVDHWPVVQAARASPAGLRDYLAAFDAGGEAAVFFGEPSIAGKYYYDVSLEGFNFEHRTLKLRDALEAVADSAGREGARSVYVGSLPTESYLPGFSAANSLPFAAPAAQRIWLGTASNVSSHYDALDNLACVIAGARRFTLFSPELTDRLYVGPIDRTMAGQPVSLAASAGGDDERFPRFRQIKDQALVAELNAGDALYLPKLWWHQVEARSPFNGLVNYWWDAFSQGLPDAPYTSLLLAMITIAERPPAERQAWKAFFDNYVFRTNGHPLAHLPEHLHGLLGPLKPDNYGRIRARVMHLLRGR